MLSHSLLVFGILSTVFAIIGFIPYIYTIHKGRTKPEKSSWWIWSFLMFMALAAQAAQGAKWSLLLTATFCVCNVIVALLSLKHGYGRFKTKDLLAFGATVLGLALWIYTKNPLTAIVVAIGVDFLGNWLTMSKTWRAPYTENLIMWFMVSIASICSLLAVGNLSTQKVLFPAYSVLVNTVCLILIFNRRQWRSKRIIAGLQKAKG